MTATILYTFTKNTLTVQQFSTQRQATACRCDTEGENNTGNVFKTNYIRNSHSKRNKIDKAIKRRHRKKEIISTESVAERKVRPEKRKSGRGGNLPLDTHTYESRGGRDLR